jgi:hypothetical protein
MLRLGLRLTVSLAAILVLTFLALSPGHKASATANPDLSGSWASAYSIGTSSTLGDCTFNLFQNSTDHYINPGPIPGSCQHNGVTTLGNLSLSATVTGTIFSGSFPFPIATFPFSVPVSFSASVSPDGDHLSNGTWNGGPYSGTWTADRLQTTPSGSGQTITAPDAGSDGASLTFGGTNPGGLTSIISAPTADVSLPAGFHLVGQYYHVITTVPHGPPGPYIFCAGYLDADNDGIEDTTHVPEATLQIDHLNDTTHSWEPQTRYDGSSPPNPYTDTDANRVCASVDHLSQFALVTTSGPVTPHPTADPNAVGGLVDIVGSDSSSGVSSWLWAATAGVAIALAAAGGWLALERRRLR